MVLGEQQQRLGQSAANESVAEAQLNLARLNLSYTVITAPCDGYIGRKDIHVGQLVQPGQLLVNVIDQNTVWVIANYRESQMHHISVGAAVEFEADAIPGVTFKGVVKSISAASGASYSNMPGDNATGNFVKVEQRVPVRIELTEDNNKTDVKRLLSGLNVECEVDY
jgi:membrane fusion protein (multidrug efflux system)